MSEHAKHMFPSKDGTFNKVKTLHNIFSLIFLQDFLNETLNNKKKKKKRKMSQISVSGKSLLYFEKMLHTWYFADHSLRLSNCILEMSMIFGMIFLCLLLFRTQKWINFLLQ